MTFQYTYQPNTKISDIFNSLKPVTRTLPNAGGTYQSTTSGTPPVAGPVYSGPVAGPIFQGPVAPAPVARPAPVAPAPVPQAPAPAALDYSKYTDPATGKVMSPQEYADFLAKRVTGGSVPNYAGNALTQGPQTTAQLTSTATDLNNQRNDIATGATDPYKAASDSGIAYSPTELAAIEKAYAGIYDPAIKDVFAKLDKKQKEDASALELKNKLALQAQKHKDDVSLKQTQSGGTVGSANILNSTTYVPGSNPTVDAFVTGLQNGTYKTTDIPAAFKGMVAQGMAASGNQSNGKSTTSALGVQALATAKDLMDKVKSGTGTTAVGGSRALGGAIFANIPGTDPSNFSNDFNTLKSQLSLDAVKYLKGQGAVSDAERALLASAVTKLNLSQSDEEFKTTLQGIIDTLQGGIVDSSGANTTSSNVTTAPDGTLVQITD